MIHTLKTIANVIFLIITILLMPVAPLVSLFLLISKDYIYSLSVILASLPTVVVVPLSCAFLLVVLWIVILILRDLL